MIDRDRARDQRLETIMAAALKTWPSDVEPDDTPATVSLTLADAKRIRQLVQTAEDYRKALAWQEWAAARDEGRAEGLGGWKPIETAPRDGEELLVWGMSIGRRVASAKDVPRHEPYEWPGGWDFPTGATHWRPLPAPPASQTQEG